QTTIPQQELDLVEYIKQLTTRHIPSNRRMVRNFASSVAQNPCSDTWITRFLHRHRNQLTSQWTTGMDSNCHNAESGYKYKLYFDLLQQKVAEYEIEPEHMYNMDEKGEVLGTV
ncbi:hypothetical protein BU25DRAFT_298792, partial [Macroventuria anomochaeta]